MLKYYYILWVDAVYYIRKKWKDENGIFLSLVITSFLIPFNIVTLNGIFYFLGFKINFLDFGHYLVSLFGIQNTSNRISGMFFMGLIYLINYILIFRNGKINNLMEKYPHQNGRIFIWYAFISIIVPFSVFIVYFLYKIS